MKVVPNIIQSKVCLFVIICQHIFSLQVLLIFITTNKKILSMSEGIQVKTTFLTTNLTKLKYFPGAEDSRYISLVINIIQKLAATINAMRPIMLIEQSILSVLSKYPMPSEAAQNISLMIRMLRTCKIGMESCLHLHQNIMTRMIKNTITPNEHHLFTSSALIVISELLNIIIEKIRQKQQIVIKKQTEQIKEVSEYYLFEATKTRVAQFNSTFGLTRFSA